MHPRRSLTSPSMVVSILALVMATSGMTWAAVKLPRNSVGSPQVKKNSLRSSDIRNRNVKSADLGTNALRTRHVADNQLGGNEILESSLGQVPSADRAALADRATAADSATRAGSADSAARAGSADSATRAASADNADQLGGRAATGYVTTAEVVLFNVALNFGEAQEFVSNGPIGLEAECRENIDPQGKDELRVLAVTREPGAFMQGDTPHSGPGGGSSFLEPDTITHNRTMGGIVTLEAGEGQPVAEDDADTGFVMGPNGEYIGIDETTAYAVHVGQSDCLLVGMAVVN